MNKALTLLSASISLFPVIQAKQKPNIVILLADDISAREFPIYGSDTWSDLQGGDTQDPKFRAKTPVMVQMKDKSCVVSTCWSATVSSPTRGQLMTGRFATFTKWWHNGDQGRYENAQGKQETWPLYESSPLMIGKVAQSASYATVWAGKTQMSHTDTNIANYGFDEGCYTPGDLTLYSPLTDFAMTPIPGVKGQKYQIKDTGKEVETYQQISYYWQPSVMVVNSPENTKKDKMQPWPTNGEAIEAYGLNTYGADVEQDYIFDFMERSHQQDKPFFVYHTAHLGHDAYDFVCPDSESKWPATPKIEWTGSEYVRTAPNITGDKGQYDDNNSLSEKGMHAHVEYLDYVIWRYLEKFKEMGITEETVFIITADNGTSGYGKGSHVAQRGMHVPFLVYSPGMNIQKTGMQDVLVNIADILPTIAELVGTEIPCDYEVSGQSLVPFLTGEEETHREWVYSYKSNYQMMRGKAVMVDGKGTWYDVGERPSDLISYPKIQDWSKATPAQRKEKKVLLEQMKQYDVWETAHDGPGGIFKPSSKGSTKPKPNKKYIDIH